MYICSAFADILGKLFKLRSTYSVFSVLISICRRYRFVHIYSTFSHIGLGVRVMVFKDTFNNISVISWRSVLLVEETRVPVENHRPAVSHLKTLSHKLCCIEYISSCAGFELTTLEVINTDCIGSCKSNYHIITTTMPQPFSRIRNTFFYIPV